MNKISACHLEVSEMMPWFINGTLERSQASFVRKHLEVCAECRSDYSFLCSVSSAVNKSSPAPIVPKPPIDAFLAGLDANTQPRRPKYRYSAWAIAASFVVASVVAALYFADRLSGTDIPTRFDTATSVQSAVSMDYVLRIHFEADTTLDERFAVIESLQGHDVIADKVENALRLVVNVPGSSLVEVERFIKTVAARAEVKSIDIVAIQLPVKNSE